MEMNKLSMCRICLVENVRMYVVANKNLQELYEKLTDAPLVTEDRRPMLACYFCCTKLKKCWQLQRKCLEAEKLFAQMLEVDYETKPQLNQDKLEFSGYTRSRIEHVSIFDDCQTENDAIKEELRDVWEGKAVENQTESEHEFHEVAIVNIQPHHSESEDIPVQHCKSKDEALLMDFKFEVKIEQENIPTHLSESEDVPPNYSESDSDDKAPSMKLNTTVKKEQEVSEKKRKANKIKRATVAKKPKVDIRRPKPEDTITAQEKETEHQHLKNIKPSIIINRDQRLCVKEKPYKCDICQLSFTLKGSLQIHNRVHTGEKPYKCDICQRCYNSKGDLRRHIRVHIGEKPYKCNICQRCFTRQDDLKMHSRVHTIEKPYKCDICLRSFTQKEAFAKHTRAHTGEKPYVCDICQRSFNAKGDLRRHIRVHTGEKPYKCNMCQRSFAQKGTLIIHNRIHTGETPYMCNICQRSFHAKGDLRWHICLHTGEKPYKCNICQRCFTRNSSLKNHYRVHTGEKPYKCDICQHSFTVRSTLARHVRVHMMDKKIKCDVPMSTQF